MQEKEGLENGIGKIVRFNVMRNKKFSRNEVNGRRHGGDQNRLQVDFIKPQPQVLPQQNYNTKQKKNTNEL